MDITEDERGVERKERRIEKDDWILQRMRGE